MTEQNVPHCYRHPERETHIRCQRCNQPICPDCMREAAVGFQCPDCVKKGGASTRQNVGTYGGQRVIGLPLVTYVLIAINVLVFVAIQAMPRLADLFTQRVSGFCLQGGGAYAFPLPDWYSRCEAMGGEVVRGITDGAWWQPLTSMFSHEAVWHIASNMIALYLLGPLVERSLGQARFLAVYLISGLSGGLLAALLSEDHAGVLGASGAIWGLLGAALVLTTRANHELRGALLQMIGLNVVITVLGYSYISWQGHLGGFLGGAAVAAVVVFTPQGPQRSPLQWAGSAAVGLVVLLGYAAKVMATG